MSNSDLKYFGNIRNRKTTGKWPLKYFVNCQHSLTEHEAWQQLPGHIGQEPYAKTRLTESHIFSVEIFPMVCLSLSPRLYSAAHMVLQCPDHRDEDSSCLCHGVSLSNQYVWAEWDHPSSSSPVPPCLQCVGGTGTGRAALQIIALFELRLTPHVLRTMRRWMVQTECSMIKDL